MNLVWRNDILGDDFQVTFLPLGDDPDGETPVRAALVRYQPDAAESLAGRPALLLVHGMTDYFFHEHVAHHYHELGYAVYGLDLRKCGRARTEGQRWHYVTTLDHYFVDLEAASDALMAEHPECTIMAHSTGGLICALWLNHLRETDPVRHGWFHGLILNSPWLGMMVAPQLEKALRPIVTFFGGHFPRLPLPGKGMTGYGESLHAAHHGEWTYDLRFKPLPGHPKYLGWLRAVVLGQDKVQSGTVDVGVPFLALCSNTTRLGKPYSPETDTADAIVDVADIKRFAPMLGDVGALHPLQGARHDVYLSLQPAREEAFRVTDGWLKQNQ